LAFQGAVAGPPMKSVVVVPSMLSPVTLAVIA
jgi:hypothetical protein